MQGRTKEYVVVAGTHAYCRRPNDFATAQEARAWAQGELEQLVPYEVRELRSVHPMTAAGLKAARTRKAQA